MPPSKMCISVRSETTGVSQSNDNAAHAGALDSTAEATLITPVSDVKDDTKDEANINGTTPVSSAASSINKAAIRAPRELAMNPKAIKARERALVGKFTDVQDKLRTQLPKDDGVIIDSKIHAPTAAAVLNEDFDFTHLMKLRSDMPFRFIKQTLLDDGPYKGHVAILIKQEKPFRIMDLPLNVRKNILGYVLQHDDKEIPVKLKQITHALTTVGYSAKNRVAILSTCKQLHAEAAPIVYNHVFQFPGTQVVAEFLMKVGKHIKFVRFLYSDTYSGNSARVMFPILRQATALERPTIESFTTNGLPKTAIKNLFEDSKEWAKSLGSNTARPFTTHTALKVFRFGRNGFHYRVKDDEKNITTVKWGPAEYTEFMEGMKTRYGKL